MDMCYSRIAFCCFLAVFRTIFNPGEHRAAVMVASQTPNAEVYNICVSQTLQIFWRYESNRTARSIEWIVGPSQQFNSTLPSSDVPRWVLCQSDICHDLSFTTFETTISTQTVGENTTEEVTNYNQSTLSTLKYLNSSIIDAEYRENGLTSLAASSLENTISNENTYLASTTESVQPYTLSVSPVQPVFLENCSDDNSWEKERNINTYFKAKSIRKIVSNAESIKIISSEELNFASSITAKTLKNLSSAEFKEDTQTSLIAESSEISLSMSESTEASLFPEETNESGTCDHKTEDRESFSTDSFENSTTVKKLNDGSYSSTSSIERFEATQYKEDAVSTEEDLSTESPTENSRSMALLNKNPASTSNRLETAEGTTENTARNAVSSKHNSPKDDSVEKPLLTALENQRSDVASELGITKHELTENSSSNPEYIIVSSSEGATFSESQFNNNLFAEPKYTEATFTAVDSASEFIENYSPTADYTASVFSEDNGVSSEDFSWPESSFVQISGTTGYNIIASYDVKSNVLNKSGPADFRNRLNVSYSGYYNADLILRNVKKSDEGIYGVVVCFEDGHRMYGIASLAAFTSADYFIIPITSPVCVFEQASANFPWKINEPNPNPCGLTPQRSKWMMNNVTIAVKQGQIINLNISGIFGNRLSVQDDAGLTIQPVYRSDAAHYSVQVDFVDRHFKSNVVKLIVRHLPTILRTNESEVCIGTNVVLDWNYTHATDCRGLPVPIDYIQWELVLRGIKETVATERKGVFTSYYSQITQRIPYSTSIIIHNIDEMFNGLFSVTVLDDDGITSTGSWNVIVQRRPLPEFNPDQYGNTTKCRGEEQIVAWNFQFDTATVCSKSLISNIDWFVDDFKFFSCYITHTPTTDRRVRPCSTTMYADGVIIGNYDGMTIVGFKGSSAGLLLRNLSMENDGEYRVKLSFVDKVLSPQLSPIFMIAMLESTKLTGDTTELRKCSDGILEFEWEIIKTDCPKSFRIEWFFVRDGTTSSILIGDRASETEPAVFQPDYVVRAQETNNLTSPVALILKTIFVRDTGTFQVRLIYNETETEAEATFETISRRASVFDKNSEMCRGLYYENTKIELTMDGEDASVSSNKTLSDGNRVIVSINLTSAEHPLSQSPNVSYFWKETRHTSLRQYFGRKCYGFGVCSIPWVITKRIPKIHFHPFEIRRDVQVGVRIIFFGTRALFKEISFYLANPLESSDYKKAMEAGSASKWKSVAEMLFPSKWISYASVVMTCCMFLFH